ncbi:ATP-binding protein [Streptomyces cyaneofuscatus]
MPARACCPGTSLEESSMPHSSVPHEPSASPGGCAHSPAFAGRTAVGAVGALRRVAECRHELPADPASLRRIRRIVGTFVLHSGWHELIDPALVCVTEMVANVCRHTDAATCGLFLQSSLTALRIVVSDASPDLPVVREPDWCSETGRGMFLLSHTADDWGAAPTAEGKDVWVELRAQGGGGG